MQPDIDYSSSVRAAYVKRCMELLELAEAAQSNSGGYPADHPAAVASAALDRQLYELRYDCGYSLGALADMSLLWKQNVWRRIKRESLRREQAA